MTDLYTEAPVASIDAARESLIERGIDTTKPGYRTSGFFIGAVALNKFGMEVTQHDVDHWVSVQGVLRSLDDLVDEDGVTDLSEPLAIVSQGEPITGLVTTAEADVFTTVLDGYTPDRREQQLGSILMWPAYEQARRQATTLSDYVGAITDESEEYVALLKTTKPESDDDQKQISTLVDTWIGNFSRAGYYYDNVFDLPSDFKEGKCQIEPRLMARLEFARLAITHGGIEAAKGVPICAVPSVLRLFKNYS